jgi:hypothetical protein
VAAFDPAREGFAVFEYLQNTEAGMLTGRLVLHGTILIKNRGFRRRISIANVSRHAGAIDGLRSFVPAIRHGRVFSSF